MGQFGEHLRNSAHKYGYRSDDDQLRVDRGPGGALTFSGAMANSGSLIASGRSLKVNGSVTGNGTATLSGSNADLEFGAASSRNVAFAVGARGSWGSTPLRASGTVTRLAQGDAIDRADFEFSNNPTIPSVTGSDSAGSFTNVAVQDRALSTALHLLNQYANQFAVDPHACSLVSDQTSNLQSGTLLQLTAHV